MDKSRKYCLVRGCASRTGEGLSLFRLPNKSKNENRLKEWLKDCKREDLMGKSIKALYNNYRICELHFEPHSVYAYGQRKRLSDEALPTFFPQIKHSSNKSPIDSMPKKGMVFSTGGTSQPIPSTSRTQYLRTSDTSVFRFNSPMMDKYRKYCLIRGCASRTGEGLSLFRLPNNETRLKEWLIACKREDLIGKSIKALYNNYRICELHFKPHSVFAYGQRKHLSDEALPNFFPQIKHSSEDSPIDSIPKKKMILSRTKHRIEKPTFNIEVKQEMNEEVYNENIPVKQEANVDLNCDSKGCTSIKRENNACNVHPFNFGNKLKWSKKKKRRRTKIQGPSLYGKIMKKQNNINGIIICVVCGNLYTKQVEYFDHRSTQHSIRNKMFCKTQCNRRDVNDFDTAAFTNLCENVKVEFKLETLEMCSVKC